MEKVDERNGDIPTNDEGDYVEQYDKRCWCQKYSRIPQKRYAWKREGKS